MISTAQLWLPILLTGAGVFIASSLIHIVLKWHNSDYSKLTNEDEVRAALGRGKPAPGIYIVPHCPDMKDLQSPEMQKKFVEGPVGFITVRASGMPTMGPHLAKWFGLNLLVAAGIAHLASFALVAGAPGIRVFHVFAIATFLAYGAGAVSDGIWTGRPWGAVSRDLLDALIYAVVSGLIFAWLWPH